MGTFMYAPGIRVLIDTMTEGTLDVTDDLASGSITLSENSVSTVSLQIVNHRRKYDGVFTPNDRVSIRMKRIRWVQVFSGYLTAVPLVSVYPRTVGLTAECSLKRLKHLYFDPGYQVTVDLVNNAIAEGRGENDAGIRDAVEKFLREIGQWDEGIHIGEVPQAWMEQVNVLADRLQDEQGITVPADVLGTGSVFSNALGSGTDAGIAIGSGAMTMIPGNETDWGNGRSATTPSGGPQPGTQALMDALLAAYTGSASMGIYANRNVRGGSSLSLHAEGRAGDFAPVNKAQGDQVAEFIRVHYRELGIQELIWWHRIFTAERADEGWRNYTGVNPHEDHVHFGQVPGAASGLTAAQASIIVGAGAVTTTLPGGGYSGGNVQAAPLMTAANWQQEGDPDSNLLTGPRALMNDESFLPWLGTMVNMSMRSYMSAPNGDFIAWFPDYFGLYGLAAHMNIQPIETVDFTITWSDDKLVTHQYVTGSFLGYGGGSVAAEANLHKMNTAGVATIDFDGLLRALVDLHDDDPRTRVWSNRQRILQRFGARPDYLNIETAVGPDAEFFWAIYEFQKKWANQFSADAPITFMPEIYPGMIARFPAYGFQAYVSSVTHSFDFADGSGFTTTLGLVAPSATGDGGGLGLPRGGGLR